MKYALYILLTGCAGVVGDAQPMPDPGGGGLPTPSCAEQTACSECVGCAAWDFACFGWEGVANLNAAGRCVATPTDGMVETSGGVAFVAEQAVAVVDGSYLAVSAHAGDAVVVLFAPATVGDHDCSSATSLAAIAYFANVDGIPGTDFRSAATSSCTLTVASVGDVGQRIEGSFSATLADWHASGATLQLAGSFSVIRAPMR
jgi:hypothetical protein